MAEPITQEQAQKLLAFVTELANTKADYAEYSGVGSYLSDNWISLADYLLEELNLKK
jgi:hypothetical protein